MGDADRGGLAFRAVGPAVAGQALVAVHVDLVATNTVGDGRWLIRVVAFALDVLVLIIGERRGGHVLGQGATGPAPVGPWRIQWIVGLGGDRHAYGGEQEQGQQWHGHERSPQAALISSIRIAHFL
ncbi:hypothetical protein D3C76_1447060 [compost metagenome]